MQELKYSDIFVPGGFPALTYNPRESLKLEERISEVKNNLCKLVVVTGHTKSGKTVLVQKNFPREESIWIDGGIIGSEDDFWNVIVDQLKLFQVTEVQKQDETTVSAGFSGTAEGSIIIAKGSATASGSLEERNQLASTSSRSISSKIIALDGLRRSKIALVIDDFHYLPKDLQGSIVRCLKPLVFVGSPVVIIAIPHRRYDAVKVEREMTGRIFHIEIPLWNHDELEYIPIEGYRLLKTKLDNDKLHRIADETLGSPHLIQEFCRAICKAKDAPSEGENISISTEELGKIFEDTADSFGRPIFEKLARGPRQRADRKERSLKDGSKVDIYGLILHALSHIRPELVTLEYEDLRAAIKEICLPQDVPNIQEVARVLKYMSEIAATDTSSSPVIDFDEEEKRLHMTDPFFAFYLRWGNLDL